ncbi:hypothetical protein [Actinomadura madurae]|uniref:hypothetical protein n=1 Tax=Actinomadura madurae TaxID=1993 RepID=UPI0020D252D0|nr:hypothetical protein [Actinomadura madurae]MCQ0005692.1 hypothetical protein [Actinomadura madurae]
MSCRNAPWAATRGWSACRWPATRAGRPRRRAGPLVRAGEDDRGDREQHRGEHGRHRGAGDGARRAEPDEAGVERLDLGPLRGLVQPRPAVHGGGGPVHALEVGVGVDAQFGGDLGCGEAVEAEQVGEPLVRRQLLQRRPDRPRRDPRRLDEQAVRPVPGGRRAGEQDPDEPRPHGRVPAGAPPRGAGPRRAGRA